MAKIWHFGGGWPFQFLGHFWSKAGFGWNLMVILATFGKNDQNEAFWPWPKMRHFWSFWSKMPLQVGGFGQDRQNRANRFLVDFGSKSEVPGDSSVYGAEPQFPEPPGLVSTARFLAGKWAKSAHFPDRSGIGPGSKMTKNSHFGISRSFLIAEREIFRVFISGILK